MVGFVNLEGCRAIIRDTEQAKVVVDTQIVEYDRVKNTISVNTWKLEHYINRGVSVLAFTSDGLYEYMGTVRRGRNVGTGRYVEIGLFKGKELENRAYTRYPLRLEGVVEGIRLSGLNMPLDGPIPIISENISASGILIKGPAKRFKLNHELQMRFIMEGKVAVFNCIVVRIIENDETITEYGCKILSVHM